MAVALKPLSGTFKMNGGEIYHNRERDVAESKVLNSHVLLKQF
jgi:hypothetical protein